jgi:hypothetical protein
MTLPEWPIEGLCPHDRILTAYCEDCAIEAEIYYPERQINWEKTRQLAGARPPDDEKVMQSRLNAMEERMEPEDELADWVTESPIKIANCTHGIRIDRYCATCSYSGTALEEAAEIMATEITAQDILQDAINAISQRAPFRDSGGKKTFELAAELFCKVTGHDLDEHDACMFLACVKLARSQQGVFHADDYTDAASYIALAGETRSGQVRPTGKRPEQSTVGEDMPPHWIP